MKRSVISSCFFYHTIRVTHSLTNKYCNKKYLLQKFAFAQLSGPDRIEEKSGATLNAVRPENPVKRLMPN